MGLGRSISDNETVAAGHHYPFNYCSREEITMTLTLSATTTIQALCVEGTSLVTDNNMSGFDSHNAGIIIASTVLGINI